MKGEKMPAPTRARINAYLDLHRLPGESHATTQARLADDDLKAKADAFTTECIADMTSNVEEQLYSALESIAVMRPGSATLWARRIIVNLTALAHADVPT
jgi:hypothetical protein